MSRFDEWFDLNCPAGFEGGDLTVIKDFAEMAWIAGKLVDDVPKPVNGNARLVGFGAPATVQIKPKREQLPAAQDADAKNIKHWNIWDVSKNRFASTGLTKQQAFYWADRYNTLERRNIYNPVPVLHD